GDGLPVDPDGAVAGLDLEAGAAHPDGQRQRAEPVGQERVEAQPVAAYLQPQVAPLQQVERTGHGAEVDAFLGRAALDVLDVAFQCFGEQVPGGGAVGAGQHPGVDEGAEGGAVAGALQVVVDGPPDEGGVGGVAEPVEDGEEFGGGEQVAQHERVGLFGGFVAVDVVAFGFQCPVQAAYSAVAVPVEFGQVGVAGELADDAVVEVDAHAAGDVGPAGGFAGADVGAGGGDLQGALQQPDGHDVGVGVVVQAGSVGAGVAGLVFVGAHDAADLVAAGGGVEHGQRGEEAGDLD